MCDPDDEPRSDKRRSLRERDGLDVWHRTQPLADTALRLLNRLSDLLFVMARVENRRAGVADVEWAGRGD